MTNFDLELIRNNSSLEYPIKDCTPKSSEVGFEHLGLEFVQRNSGMKFMTRNSIRKSLVTNFVKGIGVIMIGCYFIQLVKMMLEGQKRFIHIHEIIFTIGTGFRHLNFSLKRGTIPLVFLLSI
jgi:hypothetical protein